MNSFAESPLFFFMDNMSPIIPVKVSKDTRKIIELSDTGCDARLPATKILQNTDRSYPPKSKIKLNEDWQSYCDEKIENKYYEERIRTPNEHNTMDANAGYYSFPNKDEIDQVIIKNLNQILYRNY